MNLHPDDARAWLLYGASVGTDEVVDKSAVIG